MSSFIIYGLLGLAALQTTSATLAGPTCPGSNATQYTSYGREVFNITCGYDHAGGDLASGTSANFQACIELCANTATCVSVTFTGGSGGTGSGTCYMKSTVGTASANSGVNSAQYSLTLPALSCPGTDGQTYNLATGASALMECYTDHVGGDASMTIISTMEACITLCAGTSGCVAVSFAPGSGGFCYMKSTLNTGVTNYGVWGARMTSNATGSTGTFSPGCPGSNGTSVTDNNGAIFVVECGMDRPGGDYQEVANVGSLVACMSLCSNSLGCVDVSWVPGNKGSCYLKNSLVAQVSNSGVWGARLVANETITTPITSDFATCAASIFSGSTGCGKAIPSTLTPGSTNSLTSLNVLSFTLRDGSVRQYYMYLPPKYTIYQPAPVIISFHGNAETGLNQAGRTGFQDTTLNSNTITVYPSGVGGSWQGAPYAVAGIDDVSFVKQLFTYLSQNFCIDPTRVYATGFSNGAGFCSTLACDPVASQMFAAIGANSAANYPNNTYTASCDPTQVTYPCSPFRKRVPYLEIHGGSDGTIAYNGGNIRNECVPSVPKWMNDQAGRENYTTGTTNVTTTITNSTGGVAAYEYQWGTGATLGQVVHYLVPLGGHAWYDGTVGNGWGFKSGPTIFQFLQQWTLLTA